MSGRVMTSLGEGVKLVPGLVELAYTTGGGQEAATGLLLAVLWHPWRTRLRLRRRVRALRTEVAVLDEQQQAAFAVLTRSEHTGVLYEQLDPDGRRRAKWRLPAR
jgi:hypothetical protein